MSVSIMPHEPIDATARTPPNWPDVAGPFSPSEFAVGSQPLPPGTSSRGVRVMLRYPELNTTANGHATREPEATRQAICELRRISGLTWDQLAELFRVSRRTVQLWASGKHLDTKDERRLVRVLDIIRHADRGSARNTRAALFDSHEGTSPIQMLIAGQYDDVRDALGEGPGRPSRVRTELDSEARMMRRPLPPEELYDAKTDPVHRERGAVRFVHKDRAARRRGRGSS